MAINAKDSSQDITGYPSIADKKRFTNIAGIFCILFFLAQFIVPMVVMVSIMPSMMTSMMESITPQSGASWQDKIWYLEEAPEGDNSKFFTEGPGPTKTTLKSVEILPSGEIQTVDHADLSMKDPYLLSGGDRLWVISSSYTGFFDDVGEVIPAVDHVSLGGISRPFFHNGNPAVIEENPTGYSFLTFDGKAWNEVSSFSMSLSENSCCFVESLRALSNNGNIYFFLKKGGTLFYRQGIPAGEESGRDTWSAIQSVDSGWEVALFKEKPVLFFTESQGTQQKIKGLQLNNNTWEEFFTHDGRLDRNIGIYPFSDGGFAILQQTFPGSLNILNVDRSGNVALIDSGNGSFFPKNFMFIMFTPHLFMMFTPFILAIILTSLMKKYRVVTFESGNLKIYHASILKRAIAQIADSLIIAGPMIIGWLVMMNNFPNGGFSTVESPGGFLSGFGIIIGGFCWIIICLFAYSFMEGSWGISPGKWLVGIRVMGTDLQPCGFGRAIIRNFLKCVDGFFNFMVGIMIVALSENWQRIGDMAARTVVIDLKETLKNQLPELKVEIG